MERKETKGKVVKWKWDKSPPPNLKYIFKEESNCHPLVWSVCTSIVCFITHHLLKTQWTILLSSMDLLHSWWLLDLPSSNEMGPNSFLTQRFCDQLFAFSIVPFNKKHVLPLLLYIRNGRRQNYEFDLSHYHFSRGCPWEKYCNSML